MLPHEKELVERLKNKPFALIGINTDPVDVFKDKAAKEHVSWRNVLEGQGGGPLVRAWGVRSFPSIYILDGKGVIRFTNKRGEDMDKAVDALLEELGKPVPAPAQPPAKN